MSDQPAPGKHAAKVNAAINSALSHELRERIMEALAYQEKASPSELAAMLKVPLDTVAKHCRILRDAGLIEPIDVPGHRGRGSPTYYRSIARPMFDTSLWDTLPKLRRQQGSVGVARKMFGDLAKAIQEGTFDNSTSRVMVNMPHVRGDQQFMEETDEAIVEFLGVFERILGDAGNRLAERNEKGDLIACSFLMYQMPEPS